MELSIQKLLAPLQFVIRTLFIKYKINFYSETYKQLRNNSDKKKTKQKKKLHYCVVEVQLKMLTKIIFKKMYN